MEEIKFLTRQELEAGLDVIRKSPGDHGELIMIVRRPRSMEREVLNEADVDIRLGLVGDNWRQRGNSDHPGEEPDPDYQLTIVNSRAISLLSGSKERWPLAGDQLYVDLNLSDENLPAGTRLSLGTSIIEVTGKPHNGCKKFTDRYGLEAMKFVNSPVGKQLHLRGIYAKVIEPGRFKCGDRVRKI